jgi:hypothetical protein
MKVVEFGISYVLALGTPPNVGFVVPSAPVPFSNGSYSESSASGRLSVVSLASGASGMNPLAKACCNCRLKAELRQFYCLGSAFRKK